MWSNGIKDHGICASAPPATWPTKAASETRSCVQAGDDDMVDLEADVGSRGENHLPGTRALWLVLAIIACRRHRHKVAPGNHLGAGKKDAHVRHRRPVGTAPWIPPDN